MDGNSIATPARQILQDEGVIAFPAPNMLEFINAGMDEIVIHAPRAGTVTDSIDLAAGEALQSLPDGCIALVDITHNLGVGGSTPGKPVTRTTIERLAAARPTWRTDRGNYVRHFMYDEREDSTFYVWPTPSSVMSVEGLMVMRPTPIAALATVLDLKDIWKNALVEYVLHRAYSQGSDSAAAIELAMTHYAAFARLVGLKLDKQKRAGPGQSAPTAPAYPATEKNGAQA